MCNSTLGCVLEACLRLTNWVPCVTYVVVELVSHHLCLGKDNTEGVFGMKEKCFPKKCFLGKQMDF